MELYDGIFPIQDSYAKISAGADRAKYKIPFAIGSRRACRLREKFKEARAWAQTLCKLHECRGFRKVVSKSLTASAGRCFLIETTPLRTRDFRFAIFVK